ncbi:MAG: hypothetical protein MUE46_08080 [Xanthomonadales bacterium]|jgi:hypothetical protein|nr:hypothetical protein [Xanthomonadales bacterium]
METATVIPVDAAPGASALETERDASRPLRSSLDRVNAFILRHLRALEMAGVVMRITSFSLVSWLGPQSPFLFVWIFNTVDAVLLTWCAALRKDAAYTLLNAFWVLIGIVGIVKAMP